MFTCKGFTASAVAAGLKKADRLDLGLIFSATPATVAGVFTTNRVQAAPVKLDRQRVKAGVARAVIVNAGNANCCTGDQGMADAVETACAAARELGVDPEQVLVASTGVIGQYLPLAKIKAGVAALVKGLSTAGFADLAQAMMTTDTVPKLSQRQATVAGKTFTVLGTAKGAGMIRPDMATMLCFVVSDIAISPRPLHEALAHSSDLSFNRITIDGDTSTNDTILVLANGQSGINADSQPERRLFQSVLDAVLIDLARQVVKDGEGATKLVEIKVRGAVSDADAVRVAQTVANSNLVKTAFFGQDANWGRILAAAGRAGAVFDPEAVDLYFDRVRLLEAGRWCGPQAEAQATAVLHQPEFAVTIDLNGGPGQAQCLTCDFSIDYVKINADYRS
jgi:glutamate N-acetyltransferase/amino-acid N-acetyltransferase